MIEKTIHWITHNIGALVIVWAFLVAMVWSFFYAADQLRETERDRED